MITLARDGDPGSATPRETLAGRVQRPRTLAAQGKGNDSELADYEGARGTYQLHAIPAIYLRWFDAEGGRGLLQSARRMRSSTPVLHVHRATTIPPWCGSTRPSLPRHSHNQFSELASTHQHAPPTAIPGVMAWTQAVTRRPPKKGSRRLHAD